MTRHRKPCDFSAALVQQPRISTVPLVACVLRVATGAQGPCSLQRATKNVHSVHHHDHYSRVRQLCGVPTSPFRSPQQALYKHYTNRGAATKITTTNNNNKGVSGDEKEDARDHHRAHPPEGRAQRGTHPYPGGAYSAPGTHQSSIGDVCVHF